MSKIYHKESLKLITLLSQNHQNALKFYWLSLHLQKKNLCLLLWWDHPSFFYLHKEALHLIKFSKILLYLSSHKQRYWVMNRNENVSSIVNGTLPVIDLSLKYGKSWYIYAILLSIILVLTHWINLLQYKNNQNSTKIYLIKKQN